MGILFNTLQLIGGIILSIGYIPQIIKTIKTKSAEDFSALYFSSLVLGIFLMELYAIYNAIHGVAYMFLVTNSISLLLTDIMLVLTICYKKKKIGA